MKQATAGWGLPYPRTADKVRSATMAAIRRADTQPEVQLRSELHRRGYRFRKDYPLPAPGRKIRVDIAFPKEGLAVFVDGCYWHQCPEHGTVPQSNRDYWVPKLKRNVARDAIVGEALRRSGWKVLRVWEHVPAADAADAVGSALSAIRQRDRRRRARLALTALDLFAGAGGSTVGLAKAGYRVLAAVENDPAASETYRANHSGVDLFEQDIRKVRPRTLRGKLGLQRGELGLLNACPPCQGFSTLGASDADDERNELVTVVGPFLNELRPQSFVVENVPGLRHDARLKRLMAFASGLGYSVRLYVVNAAEFGVPQSRRRLIVVGVRSAAAEFPDHLAELLPRSFRREPEGVAGVLAEAGPLEGTRDPVHRARRSSPTVMKRIQSIPVNGGRFDLPEDQQLDCHRALNGKGGATSSYGRIRLDRPAPTLTTRCTTPACGRFVHPTEDRGISLREAALIQTFPARYNFFGTYREVEAQIGNAVPARLAEALGLSVAELVMEAGGA